MENKLTLENISPFLPYGLKAFKNVNIENELVTIEGFADDKTYGYVFLFFRNETIKSVGNYDIKYFKPVLRKTDLTKPITVEGKEIIPLQEIAKIITPQYEHMCNDKDGNAIIGYDEHISCFCPYDCNCGAYNRSFILFYDDERKNFYSTIYMDADPENIVGEETHASFEAIKWLYKHKFDVENLIDQNLAIDVETLEINPYE